jgi:hypothetical protein
VSESLKQPVHAFKDGAWPNKAAARQQRRPDARLCRPANMQSLGPGTFGEIFDDASGHAAGNAERIYDLPRVKP